MAWDDSLNPFSLVGLNPGSTPSADVAPEAGALGVAAVRGRPAPYHPDSPLFWGAILIGSWIGLIGLSTHAKFGPFKAGVDLGA